MRVLSFVSLSSVRHILAFTAVAAMGCGSNVTLDDPKGTVSPGGGGSTGSTSWTGTGGGGEGGSVTHTVTYSTGVGGAATTSTPSTSWTTSDSTTTATTWWPTACDELCAKVANECNQGDLCGSYGLDCGNPQYECPSSCVAGADCDEIQTLLEVVATQDWQALQKLSPATQSCLMGCYSTTTSTGSTGSTGTGTNTNFACGQCGQQNCQVQGCGQDPQCKPWRQCTMKCGNQSPQCFTDCNNQYPAAASKYEPFYDCMCQSCDSQCGASMDPCNQGAGSGGAGGAGGAGGTGAAGGFGGAASTSNTN